MEQTMHNAGSSIRTEDFPGILQQMAGLIGVDTMLRIIRNFGGDAVYICTEKNLHRRIRDRLIRAEYNGSNIGYLSEKYRLSHSRIRGIIRNEM